MKLGRISFAELIGLAVFFLLTVSISAVGVERDRLRVGQSENEKRAGDALPSESWSTTEGKKILGKLVGIKGESIAMILSESSQTTEQIPLSRLAGEDAYRAVERHLAIQVEKNRKLLGFLEKLVEHLERKEFDSFVKLAFNTSSSAELQGMAQSLATMRGQYFLLLDTAIAGLRDGNASVDRAPDGLQVRVRVRNRTLTLWQYGDRFVLKP